MSDFFRVFAGGILLIFTSMSCSRTEYALLYKPKLGDIYKHTVNLDITAKQIFEGQELISSKQLMFVVENKVIEVKNNASIIECCYKSISIDDDMGMGKLNSSSEDTTAIATVNNLSPLLSISKNKPFIITINQQGVIEDIEGFELIKMQMNSIVDDEDIKKCIIQYVENQIGNEALKTSFEYFTAIFPSTPVKTGNSWNTTDANSNNNFKLKKVKLDIAHIECESTIYSQKLFQLFNNFGGLSITPVLQGTQTGLVHVDALTGKPLEANIKRVLNGIMLIKRANRTIELPLSVEINVSLSSQI